MAKIVIGNVKGKDGRGITSIKKTGTTGLVDTYTITYTDNTTSTFTINNSDTISLQRQIVPSAAVESSTTASQAYTAGDYVVVNGVLRKVTAAIAKGNTIGNSNSTATTVTGELATLVDSVSQITRLWYRNYSTGTEPSNITFTVPGGLDSYDYLVFFGKTSEYKRASATLSRDAGFGGQYFQLAAPYAPTGGTDIYERMTGYKVTFSGESVTVSPQWYNEVHFSANGCEVSKGKSVPLYEVVGVRRLS